MSGGFANEISAVRTDVRDAMQSIVHISGQQKRLIEAAFEQGERKYLARYAHAGDVPNELPGGGEHLLLLLFEYLRARVEGRRQRPCFAYVLLGLMFLHGWSILCSEVHLWF